MHLIRPLILYWLLVASPVLMAESAHLIQAENLQELGETAAQKRIPILLMVSQEHCGFCERMKQEVLNPMLLSGEYDNRVVMRELLIDSGETVTDFSGRRQAVEQFSNSYKVWVTPTLLFLDHRGRETAERILGINTVDYLLFYVEQAIDDARSSMKP